MDTAAETRFEFGENWRKYLEILDDDRIADAVKSLRDMLETESLAGKSFLDIGCGSGLFSLAARKLGANVRSFDYDPQSVACTQELRRRYFPDDSDWPIERGSVLDAAYLQSLGKFDVVYSWGVLHHTGSMWQALENVIPLVADGGKLYIAIYNDQGYSSEIWKKIKHLYNELPKPLRWIVLYPCFLRMSVPPVIKDLIMLKPSRLTKRYSSMNRGMTFWRNVVDWVGGYPFEVARPEEIFNFYRSRGFTLTRITTCGGASGCNEYVFRKS